MRIFQAVSRPAGLVLGALALTACGGGEEGAEVEVDSPAVQQPQQQAEPPAGAPATAPATTPPAGGAAAPAPAASAGAAANLPQGVTAQMVQDGQQIFAGPGICFTCHGQNAQGSPLGPSLNDDEWLWITPGDDVYDQLVTLIRTGVSQPKEHPAPMPSMGGAQLNDEQLRSVAAYVYSISQGG